MLCLIDIIHILCARNCYELIDNQKKLIWKNEITFMAGLGTST